jgi:hypothetical protein
MLRFRDKLYFELCNEDEDKVVEDSGLLGRGAASGELL